MRTRTVLAPPRATHVVRRRKRLFFSELNDWAGIGDANAKYGIAGGQPIPAERRVGMPVRQQPGGVSGRRPPVFAVALVPGAFESARQEDPVRVVDRDAGDVE
jgi:hypothetical protein